MKTKIPRTLWLFLAASFLHAVPAGAVPVISEFLAINHSPPVDDQGLTSDWIEISNPGPEAVDLAGWSLTDEADTHQKWVFPQVTLNAGEFLVVRASGLDRRNPLEPLHTNFSLSGSGGFLGLYSPGDVPSTVWQPYPKQFSGFSYGFAFESGTQGYLSPSPGSDNSAAVLTSYVADTHFSVERGFFTSPFSVEIAVSTPGAVIRYTTDGSEPLESAPPYTGPVPVNKTTVLRARAYLAGSVPSNTDTQTYIFAADWKSQPALPAGYPLTWGSYRNDFNQSYKALGDYRMKTEVTNDPAYSALVIPALTQTLPVMCVTGHVADLFGDDSIQGDLRKTDNEVAVGVEYFNPASPNDRFTTRATLQMHGAAVRDLAKKAFRIDFTGNSGDGPLHHPLFPGSTVESFDQLVLRPGGHDSFASPGRLGQLDHNDLTYHASYLRDQFLRRTETEMGLLSPRGRYVHLSLNGLYWGIYDLHERPNAEMMASHGGGKTSDWDVLHHPEIVDGAPRILDGTETAWNDLQALTAQPITTDVAYQTVTALLGPDRFIDHLLVRMWAGDHDWLGPVFMPSTELGTTGNVARFFDKNWYAVRNSRSPSAGIWQFFTWDAEISMGNHLLFDFEDFPQLFKYPDGMDFPRLRELRLDLTGIDTLHTPAAPWAALRAHPEFRLKVADRVQRLLFNGGALSASAASARISSLKQELELAIVAESARWGIDKRLQLVRLNDVLYFQWGIAPFTVPLTRNTHWLPEVEWLRDVFCTERPAIFLNQLRARNLYPSVEPVVIAPFGGALGEAGTVTLTAPAGTVYYTLDGADPRTPFSGVFSQTALQYSAPFPPPQEGAAFTVKARALTGEGWSALTEATFSTAVPPTAAALAITEIHYHPADPSPAEVTAGFTDADDFEFLEITNISLQTVSLRSLRFAAGIDFDFAVDSSLQELGPGASMILASNSAAFQLRYSFAPDGVFANGTRLSNSGETLKIVTASGIIIAEVTYNDSGEWPASADGGGHSLVLLAPLSGTVEDDADHWRASTEIGGNPGTLGSINFAVWLTDYFTPAEIADPLLTGPLADPEGDGMTNLTEYVTRTNPRKPSQNPVKVALLPDGTVRFRWERRADAPNVFGELQLSTNLQTWQPATGPGITSTSSNTTRGTNAQTVDCTPASGIRYARLKVTLAP